MFGQVVIDHQDVLPLLHPVLTHRAPGVRRDPLQSGGLEGRGAHDGRPLHRTVAFERRGNRRHLRFLLADGDVDAEEVLPLLIDDRIDADGGLAGLTIPENELALAASNRDHRVNRLDARLHRRIDRGAHDHARGEPLDWPGLGRHQISLTVNRPPKRIDYAAQELVTDRNADNFAGRPDFDAFGDVLVGTEYHDAHGVLCKVRGNAHDGLTCVGVRDSNELHQLVGQRALQTVHVSDTVAHVDHVTDVGRAPRRIKVLDTVSNDLFDLIGTYGHPMLLAVRDIMSNIENYTARS